jgi:4-hydroxy-tetrahydrodipicolinate reductase
VRYACRLFLLFGGGVVIKVIVSGAYGKMGREVLKAVHNDNELALVGAVDVKSTGADLGELIGCPKLGISVGTDLKQIIAVAKPDVLVDFTIPEAVIANVRIALENGVCPVVGTTGLGEKEIESIRELCKKTGINALVSPNFSIGAILMMKMAQDTAKYFPNVEIIELHHDQKLDAPSGTAIRTAELIAKDRGYLKQGHANEFEKLSGARGGDVQGIKIHSVRLPGYVAHQEVIFGGFGQTLSIRHDSISRESFMPGVLLACKKVQSVSGLVYGLENILA